MNLIKKTLISVLMIESRLVLRRYKPTIIAVTGSVGKTSTKDAIYAVLVAAGKHVRKSDKSFNSEIGVPLTILGVPNAWRDPLGWLSNVIVMESPCVCMSNATVLERRPVVLVMLLLLTAVYLTGSWAGTV